MVSKLEFSHAVAAIRKERGLTQGQLADELARSYSAFESLNQPTLSQWESGKVTPSLLKRLLSLTTSASSINTPPANTNGSKLHKAKASI